jgi:hypothetical protein
MGGAQVGVQRIQVGRSFGTRGHSHHGKSAFLYWEAPRRPFWYKEQTSNGPVMTGPQFCA